MVEFIFVLLPSTYSVLYAFLNRSSDHDEIWYRDRFRKGDRLHFDVKKLNK